MAKEKKPKFYGWKCPKCGMLSMTRKPHLSPEEYELYEKDLQAGENIIMGDSEICYHCHIPMIPQKNVEVLNT